MKKRLVIGITFPGSVILLEGQLAYFRTLGYDTYLIAPDHERTRAFCVAEGCTLLPTPIEREISIWKDFRSVMIATGHFRRIKPHIVNAGTPKMGLVGMLAAFFTKVPVRIYTCRGFRFEHEGGIKRRILIFMELLTSFLAQRVICISPSVKDLGVDLGIFSQSKAIVIRKGSSNGINLQRFHPHAVTSDDRIVQSSMLHLQGCFVFGFVGRLVDRKGIRELFEAFEKMYAENEKIRLLLVGPAEAEQLSDKTLISRMQAHPGIVVAGMQRNVPLYLSVMDVFVLPAWWEGFGNVLIQAAAMGVPVISTNATGTKDAVSNGFNGLLVEPKSVHDLIGAMKKLMNNTEMRSRMGENGIQWARNFQSEVIWDEMNQLYLQ